MTTVRETTLTILSPGDPGWEDARQAWNLAVDQHPAAIALPSSAGDAAAAVRFARERGLRVAAQGTGHGATPMGSLADTLAIREASGPPKPTSGSGVSRLPSTLTTSSAPTTP